MSEYSPEPWRMTRESGSYLPSIYDGAKNPVVHEEGVMRIADARRIVACVNACEGYPTEFLEDLSRDGHTLHTSADEPETKQLRDQLFKAQCRIVTLENELSMADAEIERLRLVPERQEIEDARVRLA